MLNLATVDWTLTALGATLLISLLALLLQVRAVGRLRQHLNRDLARIFEQLDLVRFESQQQSEQRTHTAAVALPARAAAAPADLSSGEARVLRALQGARRASAG
jgi:hypothetical protein